MNRAPRLLLLGLLFAAAWLVTFGLLRSPLPRGEPPQSRQPLPEPPSPDAEWTLVYIGSSTCTPSNAPELAHAAAELRQVLAARAAGNGATFSTLGIARDRQVRAGLRHLRRHGEFDEVIAGRSWSNLGLQRYVWGDLPGQAATPQLLLVERTLDEPSPGQGGRQFAIQRERLLVRKVGLDEIQAWLRDGAPVPRRVPRAADLPLGPT
jgi:hypothetical protein